jgi:hypothetical protein
MQVAGADLPEDIRSRDVRSLAKSGTNSSGANKIPRVYILFLYSNLSFALHVIGCCCSFFNFRYTIYSEFIIMHLFDNCELSKINMTLDMLNFGITVPGITISNF